jgi:DNA-binding transcriptional ArsR family regulator
MPTQGLGPGVDGSEGAAAAAERAADGPAADGLAAAEGAAAARDVCLEGGGLKGLSQVMRLLCEETRLRILFTLAAGERDVTGLWSPLGLPQATVSHHLAFLRLAGLVSTRRAGKHVHYRLGPGARVTGPGVMTVECPEFSLRVELRQPPDRSGRASGGR